MRKTTSGWLAACAVLAAGTFLAAGIGAAALVLRAAAGVFAPFAWGTRVSASGPVVLTQVQALRRLETCRYNGSVVVRGDTGGPLPRWAAGDRMVFLAHGEVVAGIDLARLTAGDIRAEGHRLALRLPAAQVLHTRLDTRASEVFERQAGLFTGPDPGLETQVRLESEERLRAAALESGILASARRNAQEALRAQLAPLGFTEIRFID